MVFLKKKVKQYGIFTKNISHLTLKSKSQITHPQSQTLVHLIKNNPQNMYYPVVGIRGEMDLGDLNRFDSMKGKYDNFKPM
jgi:hypothetical protein